MQTSLDSSDKPTCDQCHKPTVVLMILEPASRGGKKPIKGQPEWELCPKCYREGLERWSTKPLEEPPPPAPRRGPRMAHEPSPRSQARQPDRDRHPNAPEPKQYSTSGARFVPDGDGFW